jgi:hypothetical protein
LKKNHTKCTLTTMFPKHHNGNYENSHGDKPIFTPDFSKLHRPSADDPFLSLGQMDDNERFEKEALEECYAGQDLYLDDILDKLFEAEEQEDLEDQEALETQEALEKEKLSEAREKKVAEEKKREEEMKTLCSIFEDPKKFDDAFPSL